MESDEVFYTFERGNPLRFDYSSYYKKLNQAKLPILIYEGEYDPALNTRGQEDWLRRLNFEGSDDFWNQSRQIYWVDDPQVNSSDGQTVGGYYRESPYLTFL